MDSNMNSNPTMRRLKIEIALIIILTICLCITSLALALPTASATQTFTTGGVNIILNGGKQIITEDDDPIAPGKTVTKQFSLENASTYNVYCRLYFSNVSGALMETITVTISDPESGTVLYHDLMKNLTRDNIASLEPLNPVIPFKLEKAAVKYFEISFSMPLNSDTALMGSVGNFDFHAEAVQADNNINQEFNDETDSIDIDDVKLPETDGDETTDEVDSSTPEESPSAAETTANEETTSEVTDVSP